MVDHALLVDGGFGAHSTYPLRMDTTDDQPDPGGVFRVHPAAYGEFEVTHNGEPAYLVEARPYELRDFSAMCWWQAHDPTTHFTRSLVCSRLTDAGRVTLSGRKLIETVDGERSERELDTDAEVLGRTGTASASSWTACRQCGPPNRPGREPAEGIRPGRGRP